MEFNVGKSPDSISQQNLQADKVGQIKLGSRLMDWHWFSDTVAGGIFYDIIKAAFMSLIGAAVLRWALGFLKERRELFIFAGGLFLIAFIVLISIPQRSRPNIEASVQEAVGAGSALTRDYVTVFSINMINSGQMPSIIKNWTATATVSDVSYPGIFPTIPKDYKINVPQTDIPDQPLSVTYHEDENIIVKGLSPIQIGSYLTGILVADFHGIDPQVFRGIVNYTITFEDVLSRKYTLTVQATGKIDPIVAIPGLHADMVCPAKNAPQNLTRIPSVPPPAAKNEGPFAPPANTIRP